LFVEASLKRITPASSRTTLAGSVMKRLAPSTMKGNLGTPSFKNNLSTFDRLMASGLPPQGTKKSAWMVESKWAVFLKLTPDSITLPSGNYLFLSLTVTKYPYGLKVPL